jgi:hypothetical protein
VNRWNTEYTLHCVAQPADIPACFVVGDCDLFTRYVFEQVMELYDVKWSWQTEQANETNVCSALHVMPRFVHVHEGAKFPCGLESNYFFTYSHSSTHAVANVLRTGTLDATSATVGAITFGVIGIE